MADTEMEEVDLAAQRKNRTTQQRAAHCLIRALNHMKEHETHHTLSLRILQDKETELETLIRRGTRCNDLILDEEMDEDTIKADEAALEVFQEATAKATRLCQELLVVKAVSCLSDSVQDSLQEVEERMTEDPTKDYSAWYPEIIKLIDEMNKSLRESTLLPDHALKKAAKDLKSRLGKLRAKKLDAPKTIKEEKSDYDPTFRLPKVHLPTFKGGLENWHAFWSRFKTAVHDNEKIKDEYKLVHLIDAVTDPALNEYLVAANDGQDGRYQEVIAYLQERFNQPRELHSIYCKKLAELQPIKGTPAELSQAADTVFAAVTGIQRSEQDTISHIATSLVVSIMPKQLRQEWENKTEDTKEVPDIYKWIEFVRKKATHANQEQKAAGPYSRPPRENKRPERSHHRSDAKVHVAVSQTPEALESPPARNKSAPGRGSSADCKYQCKLCSSYHYIFSCRQFLDMNVQQRKEHIQTSSLCSNCLRSGHAVQDCKSDFRCKLCKGQHNTLLHVDSNSTPAIQHGGVHVANAAPTTSQPGEKLMMTSQVLLTGPSGKQMVVRAMLDTGANTSVISNKVMQNLHLKKLDHWVTLTGVERSNHAPVRPTAQMTIASPYKKDWSKTVTVAAVPKVMDDLPNQDVSEVKLMSHIKDLKLADPYFHEPRRVDLILDVDVFNDILLPERLKGPPGTPTAWKTELGWGIMGRYIPDQMPHSSAATVTVTNQTAVETKLSDALEKFWKIEELPKGTSLLTPEESDIQNHYIATHVFSPPAGRYVVTLPRRESTLESRNRALNRYKRNEQSLLKKGTWTQFQAVVQEYLSLGHAQLVTPQEKCTPVQDCYYLPMHAVHKTSSTSTKLRVVFDASCPTTTGVSLNNILAAGPTLHPNLDKILLRFRSYRVALSGDIGKMYQEVLLCVPDRQLHRFLWRPNPDQPVQDYCMNRVTFGVTSSPYAAVRTLQQTAMDFSSKSSLASWHVFHSFYVDDLLAGADSVAMAVQLFKELREVLSKGGFDLRSGGVVLVRCSSRSQQNCKSICPVRS